MRIGNRFSVFVQLPVGQALARDNNNRLAGANVLFDVVSPRFQPSPVDDDQLTAFDTRHIAGSRFIIMGFRPGRRNIKNIGLISADLAGKKIKRIKTGGNLELIILLRCGQPKILKHPKKQPRQGNGKN